MELGATQGGGCASWPLEERSPKNSQRKSHRSSPTSHAGYRGPRRCIAASPLPPGVKGARSPERSPEAPLGSRADSPHSTSSSVENHQRRPGRSSSRDHHDEDDRDSEPGLLPQIVPELPAVKLAEGVTRQRSAMETLQTELMVLHRELQNAACSVHLVDADIFNWEVELTGPEGSPYQGGTFCFVLKFPADYPKHMPRIRCATPIFHCNIDQSGSVCLGPFSADGLSPTALVPRIDIASTASLASNMQLRITIINARGLRNLDFGGISDPYCTCQVPGKDWSLFQTAVMTDTLHPVWNEEHIMKEYVRGDALAFELWDDDEGLLTEEPDQLLGRATLESKLFDHPEGFEGDLILCDTGKGHRSRLRVKVSVAAPRRKDDRVTALSIVQALISILTLPVLDSPLVPSAARLFREDRRKYDHVAREWTLRHAL